jgi:hypothetical protein
MSRSEFVAFLTISLAAACLITYAVHQSIRLASVDFTPTGPTPHLAIGSSGHASTAHDS